MNFNQLLEQSNDELIKVIKNPQLLLELVQNGHLAKYGLHNAVSIKIQKLNATALHSIPDIWRNDTKVKPQEKPIFIYTPINKTYFYRGTEKIPVKQASPEEQKSIIMNQLRVENKIEYMAKPMFDISQVEEPNLLYLRGLKVDNNTITNLIDSFKLKHTTSDLTGLAIKSIYNINDNTIVSTKSATATDQISAICEAVVENTCTFPKAQKEIASKMLAITMISKMEQAIPSKIVCALSDSCNFNGIENIETMVSFTTKASNFLTKNIKDIEKKQDELELSKSPNREQVIANFQNNRRGE